MKYKICKIAKNFPKAAAKRVLSKFEDVDIETYQNRLQICNDCEKREEDVCTECGCFLEEKLWWKSEKCPLGFWE